MRLKFQDPYVSHPNNILDQNLMCTGSGEDKGPGGVWNSGTKCQISLGHRAEILAKVSWREEEKWPKLTWYWVPFSQPPVKQLKAEVAFVIGSVRARGPPLPFQLLHHCQVLTHPSIYSGHSDKLEVTCWVLRTQEERIWLRKKEVRGME